MVIGEIQKNAMDKIIVQFKEYKGVRFLDARVYYEDAGEWKPSKKGIAIAPDKIDALIELLRKADKEK